MDVTFETQKGEKFTIEIGYFDTVLEIKEKIQKYREIPISNQTLIFNGKILEDNGDVSSCVILHNSYMHLIVANHLEKPKSPEKLKIMNEDFHSFSKKIRLFLKLPISNSQHHQRLSIEVDLCDSVAQLKENLYQIEGFPKRPLTLYVKGIIELQDNRHLREYELTDGSEIDILIKPSSVPTPSGMTNTISNTSAKKLKVIVLSKCETKKLIVDVNPMDRVQVLRNELEKLQQKVNFQLPPEGYFFIYNQNVMEEKETFHWHNVRQGDTIDIFNGSVTGGS
ncbi:hypothetical protein BVRB_000770 [Beta vulgaris subsp. vulgaris]|uniref:Ubiquitin-like domain-containing protein n=1 Tax=Beta vulgaris subsp. vulgaris TaxID=3555 RepID=A0A0J8B8V9_BETVV|nr:ubiquitin domain-containing protein 7SL RNA1 [Beta vulgaris subsp. vulgaris]KMS96272.1 hypothetical protein BVRB_000770 [Beta vulgaris subsp. vulgaris]